MRYAVTPSIQVIADGSVVSYRRVGSTVRERDGSGLVGLHWLHSRGWIQVNVSRFSPGESPTLNSPLQIAPGSSPPASSISSSGCASSAAGRRSDRTSIRARRWPPGSRCRAATAPAVRRRADAGRRALDADIPGGSRRSHLEVRHQPPGHPERYRGLSADFQTAIGRMNGFLRVARRNNVTSASRAGSYTQRDVSGQFFLRLTQSAQIFGLARRPRNDRRGGRWQYLLAGWRRHADAARRQGLWLRTEGTISRNADLLTRSFVPRESLSLGVNGHIAPRTPSVSTSISTATALNTDDEPVGDAVARARDSVAVDRLAVRAGGIGPVSHGAGTRAFATVKGMVYADWNGNGLSGPGRESRRRRAASHRGVGAVETGKDGEFIFRNVPDGLHDVGLDPGSLPIDFDAPRIPRVQVALSGKDTKEVAFGLIPLGASAAASFATSTAMASPTPASRPWTMPSWCSMRQAVRAIEARKVRIRSGPERRAHRHAADRLASRRRGHRGRRDSGRHARPRSHGDRAAVSRVVETRAEIRKVFPGAPPAVPKPGAPSAVMPRPAPSLQKPNGRAKPDPTPARPPRRAPTPNFALQVAAFDDPPARPADGRRPEGEGPAGVPRGTAADAPERSISRARWRVREPGRRRARC